jgi:hypothetical protein
MCLVQSKNRVISTVELHGTIGWEHDLKKREILVGNRGRIATVAVARTIHTHVAPSGAHVTTGRVIGTTPAPTPLHRQGIIVCGMALDANCEKLETLLPM